MLEDYGNGSGEEEGNAFDGEDRQMEWAQMIPQAEARKKRGPRLFNPKKPFIKLNDKNASKHTAISCAQARFFTYLSDFLAYKCHLFPKRMFAEKSNGFFRVMLCKDRDFRQYVDKAIAEARRLLRRNQLRIFEACILDRNDSIITGFHVYATANPQFVNREEVIETFDEMFRPAIAQLNQFVPKDNVMQRIENEETRFEIRMQAIGFDKEAVDELKEISPSDRLKPLINSLDTQTHQLSIWEIPMNRQRIPNLVSDLTVSIDSS
ncbi:hypothetical protein WR25_15985 [Diploscapter pachys]|uniref:HORMA domain-containing protein n=1 Tax=Diploscapter pachys TaxID=2018661 RepID=A0A2A2M141_9BILA|nr:hypothetical protein WR25_15985 [Diploscapter pachys]